uniref:Probable arginine--tRNA ligase, mitochondrial n=1 Tax=Graphocephala atropunctata TaxID=36148 RepID=A0A1B6KMN9_9HEMI
MAKSLKCKIHLNLKVAGIFNSKFSKDILPTTISKLLLYRIDQNNGRMHLVFPFKSFKKLFPESSKEDFYSLLKLNCDDIVNSVETSLTSENDPNLVFNLDQKLLIQDVLLNNCSLNEGVKSENIVMDYSSPNVAKPFHMGHLRSTIIGNFLANLYDHVGHKVTRLTYLGDWGTQFGVLQLGFQMLNLSDAELKRDPIQQLYNAYIVGNRLVEEEEEAADEARNIFSRLESNDESPVMERWKMIRKVTVDELEKTYARLGVKFDEYHWESMYNAKAFAPILQVMESNNLLEEEDGKKVMVLEEGRRVPLLKSDGSTLYLTRDVTAALDRWVRFRFDRMVYVVDNSQHQHFTALQGVLRSLEYDWAHTVQHVKFGRIQGMSTRKGKVVFLKDILDEAKHKMIEKQHQSPTTRNFSEEISDVLGVSAIIVNDLKQRRMRDYSFDWNSALQMEGDSGVKLQYTHCRLSSLEQSCGVTLPDTCDPSLLTEPEALALVLEIARMEEAVERAYEKMEAYEIVNYLFRLCNKTSQALKTLNVKHQSAVVAEQRLLLFHRARIVLHSGMRLLGLRPLTEM